MVVFGINKNNGVSNKIDENFYKHIHDIHRNMFDNLKVDCDDELNNSRRQAVFHRYFQKINHYFFFKLRSL